MERDFRRANLPRPGTYRRPGQPGQRPPPQEQPPGGQISRRNFLRVGGVAALIGLGLGGGAGLSLDGGREFTLASAPNPRALPAARATPAPPYVPRHAPAPSGPAAGGAVVRLEAPSIDVAADVVALGMAEDGTLDRPPDPRLVGWYAFSRTPDSSTNVVFAGHVNWRTGEPAAFRRLRELLPGAEITVTDALGRRWVYRTFSSLTVAPEGSHVAALVGPQPQPICTLISCDGTFDLGRRQYTDRRLVQAALAESPA